MSPARAIAGLASFAMALVLASCSGSGSVPDRSSSSRITDTSAARKAAVAKYGRAPVRTAFGDPALLDVCAVASTADTRGAGGSRLVPSRISDAAGCTLSASSSSGTGPSGRIEVTVDGARPAAVPPFATTPQTVSFYGLPMLVFPYLDTLASRPRVLAVPRAGLTRPG